jgi:hypothetical protein
MYGHNAENILQQWKGRRFWMVDPWELQPSEVYKQDQSRVRYDLCQEACEKLCLKFPAGRTIKGYSPQEAVRFLDGQLDFVYIDGNHCYEAVAADLNGWWPKVKVGGLLCGHDCYNAVEPPHYTEVKRALEDWVSCMEMVWAKDVFLTPCSSWWIVKR